MVLTRLKCGAFLCACRAVRRGLLVLHRALMPSLSRRTYQFDKGHTQIRISWNHLGLSEQSALFREYEGTVTFDRVDVSNSAVNVTIDPASVDTGVPDFDDHLKSSDFFHVEEHQEVTFKTNRSGPDRQEYRPHDRRSDHQRHYQAGDAGRRR